MPSLWMAWAHTGTLRFVSYVPLYKTRNIFLCKDFQVIDTSTSIKKLVYIVKKNIADLLIIIMNEILMNILY